LVSSYESKVGAKSVQQEEEIKEYFLKSGCYLFSGAALSSMQGRA
jgi:hypothetical protein